MKTDNGYVPQSVGEEFQLGDYGYFNGSVWNRMGNIRDLSICELQTINRPSHTSVELRQSIEIKVLSDNQTTSGLIQSECQMIFEKADSFYQQANVDHYEIYSSIDEVSRLLKDLYSKGLWKPKHCLIVNVVHSSSFLTFFSRSKGAKLKLNFDLKSKETAKAIDVGGALEIESNENEVTIVERRKIKDSLHASGARFVQLKRVFPYVTNRREGSYMGIDEALQIDNSNQEDEMHLVQADEI